jgi:hypothetical protein
MKLSAVELLVHLETKLEAAIAAADESLPVRLEEMARFVREIAEAALVVGDEVALQETRRLATKLGPFGFGASVPGSAGQPAESSAPVERTCPRCGQSFRGPAGPFEKVGSLFCGTCARELISGIRL